MTSWIIGWLSYIIHIFAVKSHTAELTGRPFSFFGEDR